MWSNNTNAFLTAPYAPRIITVQKITPVLCKIVRTSAEHMAFSGSDNDNMGTILWLLWRDQSKECRKTDDDTETDRGVASWTLRY